jgi:hypothetical protein
MPSGLPKGKKGTKFSEVFSKSANVNWLSAARVFLFGARDVWFVVGIPIYFYAVLSNDTEDGNRAAFFMIGTMDVGFYYMANAGGRLIGTLLSGLTYQIGGLTLVMGTAAVMVVLAALTAGRLTDHTNEVTV